MARLLRSILTPVSWVLSLLPSTGSNTAALHRSGAWGLESGARREQSAAAAGLQAALLLFAGSPGHSSESSAPHGLEVCRHSPGHPWFTHITRHSHVYIPPATFCIFVTLWLHSSLFFSSLLFIFFPWVKPVRLGGHEKGASVERQVLRGFDWGSPQNYV